MTRWIEPKPIDVPDALKQRVGGHPLVTETLTRRGFGDLERAMAFLNPELYKPTSPYELPNMERAVDRVMAAVANNEKICVWGDFDVDGQTSTTVLVETLRDLGAEVMHHIPIRSQESHGMGIERLTQIINDGAKLILTCDTGITDVEPVAFAQAQGVDVVITDHHTLPAELPKAYATVNAQMVAEDHPLRTLPGVGVAYKLAEALYERAGKAEMVEKHLDLVALGIVADIAVQRDDTRYLLQKGLERLRDTERLGLKVLMRNAELNPMWLAEEHIGFGIGPRLNALGRLDDANIAVELLTTNDAHVANQIATQLEGLNARRKLMCDQVFDAAMAQIEQEPTLLDSAALVLSHSAWPAGVIGIVASRLMEHFHKPAIMISTALDAEARGSARSIEGCNITDAIATQADLLKSFGGHPMAAGLVMETPDIERFRRGVSKAVEEISTLPQEPRLLIDGYLSLSDISLDLIADLDRLGPFGAGNPPLIFVSHNVTLSNPRKIGRNMEHRQLIVKDEAGCAQKVMWWRGSEWPLPRGRFDLAYTIKASNFQGRRELQMEWLDAREIGLEDGEPIELFDDLDVIDHRFADEPHHILQKLQQEQTIQIWYEGEVNFDLLGRNRHELSPADALVVWSAPPSPDELYMALEAVAPKTVVLFGVNPSMDAMQPLLSRLAGLLKFALSQREGLASVSRLAAATAQTEQVVRLGIDWLAAKGLFKFYEEGDTVELQSGTGEASPNLPRITKRLQEALSETAAYRAYFLKADKDRLVQMLSQDDD